jgi:hypothetical protein
MRADELAGRCFAAVAKPNSIPANGGGNLVAKSHYSAHAVPRTVSLESVLCDAEKPARAQRAGDPLPPLAVPPFRGERKRDGEGGDAGSGVREGERAEGAAHVTPGRSGHG